MLTDPDLHLFLDDAEIDARDGVTRYLHTLRREGTEPILVADRAWEGPQIAYGCVVRQPGNGRYALWYNTHEGTDWPFRRNTLCLAVSEDGVHWEKPQLDAVREPNGAKTNIVVPVEPGDFADNLVVVPNPADDDPARRFVAVQFRDYRAAAGRGEREYGVYALSSPDGVHWSLRQPAVLPRQGDRTNMAWDPRRVVFLLATRHLDFPVLNRGGVRGQKRDVDLWESRDLLEWQHRGRLLAPDELDPPDLHFYSMLPVPYGAGYLGLIEAYHTQCERLDIQLAWSKDGQHWNRVGARQPVFTVGGEGSWDSHRVCVTANPPERVGDRLRFWYTGGSNPHGSGGTGRRSVGLSTIRRDGLVSMDGSHAGGTLTTGLVDADAPRRLTVNVDARTGRCTVAVLSREGSPLPGFTHADSRLAAADAVDAPVTWTGGTEVPASGDGAVRLQFFLQRASLFSYRWTSGSP